MTPFRLILFVCLFGFAAPSSATTLTQVKGNALLEIRFDGETLALSDLITVTLTIKGSPALQVHGAPLELPPAAPWLLWDRSSDSRESIDANQVRWRLTYRFAPREVGKKVPFAFPVVKYRDGAERSVSWDPVAFEIHTIVTKPTVASLRDSAVIEELPPLEPPDSTWQLGAVLAGAAFLAVAAGFVIRKLLRQRVKRSPSQIALYEWQRLVAMKLLQQGRSERFVTLLTMLVRRFLERQFSLAARRQTTPEFLEQLDSSTILTAAEKQFLKTFLLRCDAVKFANEIMPADECMQWAEAAKQFLQAHNRNP